MQGLRTGTLHCGASAFEITLNLMKSSIEIQTLSEIRAIPLLGQSASSLNNEIRDCLAVDGISVSIDQEKITSDTHHQFSVSRAEDIMLALVRMVHVFQSLKCEQRRETGPILFWPHHFDLAMLWFSGRLVPDTDPEDEEHSDEQINIGFSVGDESVHEPYFYATAYPLPDTLSSVPLPNGAAWQADPWQGVILPYKHLVNEPDGATYLLELWRAVLSAGKKLMQ